MVAVHGLICKLHITKCRAKRGGKQPSEARRNNHRWHTRGRERVTNFTTSPRENHDPTQATEQNKHQTSSEADEGGRRWNLPEHGRPTKEADARKGGSETSEDVYLRTFGSRPRCGRTPNEQAKDGERRERGGAQPRRYDGASTDERASETAKRRERGGGRGSGRSGGGSPRFTLVNLTFINAPQTC